MPNFHDDDCDCAGCRDDEDRFWREQAGELEFDISDIDDQDDGPCSHVFNGDTCDRCGAEYDPIAHGHRVVPGGDAW